MFVASSIRTRTSAGLAALLLGISLSVAEESAAPDFGTNAVASFTGTIGWVFGHQGFYPIYVTRLGIYDAGGDGLAGPHVVGLWTANGNLLVSATVPAGGLAPLERGYRYASIEPFALMPAQYVIGGQFSAGDADLLRFGPAWGLGPELYFPLLDYKPGRYTVSPELSFPELHSGAPACEGCGMIVPWVVSFQYALEPPPTRPSLTAFQIGADKLELRWPTNNSTGYVLEFVADLEDSNWSIVKDEPVVVGESFSLIIEPSLEKAYFRLQKLASSPLRK